MKEYKIFESKAKWMLEQLITFYLENPDDEFSKEFHSKIQEFALGDVKMKPAEELVYRLVRTEEMKK